MSLPNSLGFGQYVSGLTKVLDPRHLVLATLSTVSPEYQYRTLVHAEKLPQLQFLYVMTSYMS
jgi:hypothetical protein